ncbi:MAG: hypothetical protein ABI543_05470 [Ignavibacteria bacterium]
MKNSQIIKILSAFTKPELRSFGRFVNSPFYNTSEATTKLFNVIKKFYPDFSGDGLAKKDLFAEVYGNRKYSNLLFNKLVSNLIKLSLEFIATTNNPLKRYSLLRGLRKKRLRNLFKSSFIRIEKELDHANLNEGDTVHQMLINMENANFNLDIDNYSGLEISGMRHMELNTLYFLERIAANYIEKTNIAVTREIEKNKIIKNLNNSIDYEGLYEQISGSNLFYKKRLLHFLTMILLHKTRKETFYHQIKASLFDTPLWDEDIINLAYIYLLDFITYKVKSGDDSYFFERHLVYKKIEHDSFASGNVKIIFTFFRNFILSGINTGDFQWSKYVLSKYIDEIEGKGNTGIKFYFEALISFHEGNFESALHAVNKLDPKNMALDKFGLFIDIRFLKFKIYFELNQIEESLAMIDAFEHFLRKDDKINKSVLPAYRGFIKYYKKLITCRIKDDYSALENIHGKLQKEKSYEKKWLLKKARELAGNIK